MNETIMQDLRFYIELYVDCGYTYDEAKLKAVRLLSIIGVEINE